MADLPMSPPSHTSKSPFLTVHFTTSESVNTISFKWVSSNLSQYIFDVVIYCIFVPDVLEEFNAFPVLCWNSSPNLTHDHLCGISNTISLSMHSIFFSTLFIIRVIITSEDDRFFLITFDFSLFYQFFFLSTDAFQ